MSVTIQRPAPELVGARAAQILTAAQQHSLYKRLSDSSQAYSDCWATYTGYPTIARWDIDTDKGPLFDEAMKAFSLKAAVFEMTGDEAAAELLLSLPVDEMTHAVLAQKNILGQIEIDLQVLFPHMTDLEIFGWEPGDYTDQCYQAAGWGVPNPRYWIGTTDARRRLTELAERHAQGGLLDNGRRHHITFDELAGLATV